MSDSMDFDMIGDIMNMLNQMEAQSTTQTKKVKGQADITINQKVTGGNSVKNASKEMSDYNKQLKEAEKNLSRFKQAERRYNSNKPTFSKDLSKNQEEGREKISTAYGHSKVNSKMAGSFYRAMNAYKVQYGEKEFQKLEKKYLDHYKDVVKSTTEKGALRFPDNGKYSEKALREFLNFDKNLGKELESRVNELKSIKNQIDQKQADINNTIKNALDSVKSTSSQKSSQRSQKIPQSSSSAEVPIQNQQSISTAIRQNNELAESYKKVLSANKKANDFKNQYPRESDWYPGLKTADYKEFKQDGFIELLKEYYKPKEVKRVTEEVKGYINEVQLAEKEYSQNRDALYFAEEFNKKSLDDKIKFIGDIAKDNRQGKKNLKSLDNKYINDKIILDDGTSRAINFFDLRHGDETFDAIKGRIKDVVINVDDSLDDLSYMVQSRLSDLGENINENLNPIIQQTHSKLSELFQLDDKDLTTFNNIADELGVWNDGLSQLNLDAIEKKNEEIVESQKELNQNAEAELSTLEKKLQYLKDIKAESKFMETADEKRSDMEDKAWDAGGNNPKSEADSLNKIKRYEELCEHIDRANDALDEFNEKYKEVIITKKNGENISLYEASDLDEISLAKNGIKDIQFVLREEAEAARDDAAAHKELEEAREQAKQEAQSKQNKYSSQKKGMGLRYWESQDEYDKFHHANEGELQNYKDNIVEVINATQDLTADAEITCKRAETAVNRFFDTIGDQMPLLAQWKGQILEGIENGYYSMSDSENYGGHGKGGWGYIVEQLDDETGRWYISIRQVKEEYAEIRDIESQIATIKNKYTDKNTLELSDAQRVQLLQRQSELIDEIKNKQTFWTKAANELDLMYSNMVTSEKELADEQESVNKTGNLQITGAEATIRFIDEVTEEMAELEKQSNNTREALFSAMQVTRYADSSGSSLDLLSKIQDDKSSRRKALFDAYLLHGDIKRKDKTYLPDNRLDYDHGYYYTDEEYEGLKKQYLENNKHRISNKIKNIVDARPSLLIDLQNEADVLKRKLEAVNELSARISKQTSIKNIKADDIAEEAGKLNDIITDLYENGGRNSEEYVVALEKIDKLLEREVKMAGGVKGSGASSLAKLRNWIFNSWEQDTGKSFNRTVDGLFGGGRLSLYGEDGKKRTVRSMSAELLGKDEFWIQDDVKKLAVYNSVISFMKDNGLETYIPRITSQLEEEANAEMRNVSVINEHIDVEKRLKALSENNLSSGATTPSAIDEITQAEDRMGNEAQEATDQARQGLAEMREEAEKTGKVINGIIAYRGTNGDDPVTSNASGATFWSNTKENARRYGTNDDIKTLFSAALSMKNALEIDAKGAKYGHIKYLGDGSDEASKKIIELTQKANECQKELLKLQSADESNTEAMQRAATVALEYQKALQGIKAISDDDQNPYGTHSTDWFADYAKAHEYDGVYFKNVIDTPDAYTQEEQHSDVYVTFQREQLENVKMLEKANRALADSQREVQHTQPNETPDSSKRTSQLEAEADAERKLAQATDQTTEAELRKQSIAANTKSATTTQDEVVAEEKLADAAVDTANNVEKATTAIKEKEKAAKKASKAKKDLTKANKDLSDAAVDTANNVNKETTAINDANDAFDKGQDTIDGYIRSQKGDVNSDSYSFVRALNKVTDENVSVGKDKDGNQITNITHVVKYDKLLKELIKDDTAIYRLEQQIADARKIGADTTGLELELLALKEERDVLETLQKDLLNGPEYAMDQSHADVMQQRRDMNMDRLTNEDYSKSENARARQEHTRWLRDQYKELAKAVDEYVDATKAVKDLDVIPADAQQQIDDAKKRYEDLRDSLREDPLFKQSYEDKALSRLVELEDGYVDKSAQKSKYDDATTALLKKREEAYKKMWKAKAELADTDSSNVNKEARLNKIIKDNKEIYDKINSQLDQTIIKENSLIDIETKYQEKIDESIAKQKDRSNSNNLNVAGNVDKTIENFQSKFKLLEKKDKNTKEYLDELQDLIAQLETFRNQSNKIFTEKDIAQIDSLSEKIKTLYKEASLSRNKATNENSITKDIDRIGKILSSNTKTAFVNSQEAATLKSLLVQLKQFDASRPAAEFEELHTKVLKAVAAFNEMDDAVKGTGFLGNIGHRLADMNAKFIAQYFSFQDFVRYARTAFTSIVELDTALVDLRKTTTMNTDELNQFYFEANKVAKQLGVTTAEVINQASAWSRLGYSSKEAATEMAKLSSQFASISPGMDTETAQSSLVSIMKAWDIDVADVESEIMDKINILGNNFAESNLDIVEGMQRSSAALSAVGTSYQDAFALFTGGKQNDHYVQKCA